MPQVGRVACERGLNPKRFETGARPQTTAEFLNNCITIVRKTKSDGRGMDVQGTRVGPLGE